MTSHTTEVLAEEGAAAVSPPISSSKKRGAPLPEIEVDLKLPEPPSKKARRALKRGKPLQPTAKSEDEKDPDDDEDGGDDGGKDAGGKTGDKKKARSPYGVWIGNLPFAVSKADLRRWLVDNSGGTIADEAITRVHMPTTKPNRKATGGGDRDPSSPPSPNPDSTSASSSSAGNKGFAYVDFATYDAAVAAIALSETDMGGRRLLIKSSTNFEGRPKPSATEGENADDADPEKGSNGKKGAATARGATKIFVGNLSYGTNEDELRAHFEKCGPIRWVKVATFEDTGKCKGYAWVNFEGPEGAAWAVKGFVKIREPVETIEDFMEEGGEQQQQQKNRDGGDAGTGAGAGAKADRSRTERKTKGRKWWVNQLQGRTLKIELAEDDQLRYKKRFRKGGGREGGGRAARAEEGGGDGGGGGGGKQFGSRNSGGQRHAQQATEKVEAKEGSFKYHGDASVARLTGAAVKPLGKKVTFD